MILVFNEIIDLVNDEYILLKTFEANTTTKL